MQFLGMLARLCAIAAGMLLTAVTLITCVSLVGRNTLGLTLAGDFELTGLVAGAAVALFLPLCQFERGNIIVDFFTAKAGPRATGGMDRAGALVMAVIMASLAWRTGLGGLSAFRSSSGTMILDLPEWLTYACMVPPLLLTAAIASVQAVRGDFPAPAQDLPEQPVGTQA